MNEVITYAHTRDINLSGNAGTLALITLDNGKDHKTHHIRRTRNAQHPRRR